MSETCTEHLELAGKREETGAMTLTSLREVSVRYSGPRRKLFQVQQATDVKNFLNGILLGDVREHFFALYLDGAHQVASFATTSIGTANATPVHPRDVFQPAMLCGAVAVIVAHNHPSGPPEPSPEDRQVTRWLKEAGTLLRITLLDHIVFTTDEYFSFAEAGEI